MLREAGGWVWQGWRGPHAGEVNGFTAEWAEQSRAGKKELRRGVARSAGGRSAASGCATADEPGWAVGNREAGPLRWVGEKREGGIGLGRAGLENVSPISFLFSFPNTTQTI